MYLVYHLRWQVSAWLMLPLMLLLESLLPLWANLMAGQFFGAIVFWFIDKKIFEKNHEEEVQDTMNDDNNR